MAKPLSLLDNARIASPCSASWSQMKGDDRVRYCEDCRLNVYNFAAMSRDEGEKLIRETEGRLCGVLYRRADGTVLTRDCPVGLMAIRRGMSRIIRFSAAACLAICGVALTVLGQPVFAQRVRYMEPFARVCNWLAPPPSTPLLGATAFGEIALPVIPASNQGKIAVGSAPQSGCNGG